MTGAELYSMFIEINSRHGLTIDTWEELDSFDRIAWSALAGRIETDHAEVIGEIIRGQDN